MTLTKAQRRELQWVADSRNGLVFLDDADLTVYVNRHLKALKTAGFITIERKSGPFGAWGHWLRITDAGREVLDAR